MCDFEHWLNIFFDSSNSKFDEANEYLTNIKNNSPYFFLEKLQSIISSPDVDNRILLNSIKLSTCILPSHIPIKLNQFESIFQNQEIHNFILQLFKLIHHSDYKVSLSSSLTLAHFICFHLSEVKDSVYLNDLISILNESLDHNLIDNALAALDYILLSVPLLKIHNLQIISSLTTLIPKSNTYPFKLFSLRTFTSLIDYIFSEINDFQEMILIYIQNITQIPQFYSESFLFWIEFSKKYYLLLEFVPEVIEISIILLNDNSDIFLLVTIIYFWIYIIKNEKKIEKNLELTKKYFNDLINLLIKIYIKFNTNLNEEINLYKPIISCLNLLYLYSNENFYNIISFYLEEYQFSSDQNMMLLFLSIISIIKNEKLMNQMIIFIDKIFDILNSNINNHLNSLCFDSLINYINVFSGELQISLIDLSLKLISEDELLYDSINNFLYVIIELNQTYLEIIFEKIFDIIFNNNFNDLLEKYTTLLGPLILKLKNNETIISLLVYCINLLNQIEYEEFIFSSILLIIRYCIIPLRNNIIPYSEDIFKICFSLLENSLCVYSSLNVISVLLINIHKEKPHFSQLSLNHSHKLWIELNSIEDMKALIILTTFLSSRIDISPYSNYLIENTIKLMIDPFYNIHLFSFCLEFFNSIYYHNGHLIYNFNTEILNIVYNFFLNLLKVQEDLIQEMNFLSSLIELLTHILRNLTSVDIDLEYFLNQIFIIVLKDLNEFEISRTIDFLFLLKDHSFVQNFSNNIDIQKILIFGTEMKDILSQNRAQELITFLNFSL